MASPHLAEQVGRVLDGRYRVIAPIGTGASAAVYLADDTTLRRRVALKVLHAALAGDQGFLKRFQAEAHTAAGLSHPNIMRVLDWGEADDGPFLVLEYLGGGSLRTILDQQGKLSVGQAVHLGIQAARALDYAHRRGLVHRDVKPGNLLFDEEGRLAIADFGLARALAEAAWTEPGGAVLGTARYAAPEQVRGYSLDGKADVYALGLILFEAVCGYVPFTADTTIATLMARLDVQLEVPPEFGAGPLAAIIEAATNPDRDERIDALELVVMLEQAAAQLPAPAPIPLPGALANDSIRIDGIDQTMMPGMTGLVPPVPSAPPMSTESETTVKPTRRALRRQHKADEAAARAASTAAASSATTLGVTSSAMTQATPAASVASPQSARKSEKTPKIKKPRRGLPVRKLVIALLMIVLVAGSGTAAYAAYTFTGREYVVPQLENLSPDQARAAAKDAHVKLHVGGQAFSETVPVGMTVAQSPASGGHVHARQAVQLKISKGPAPRPVVNETGQTIDAAKAALEAKGFVVDVTNKFSETDPTGKVLDQNPTTGELAKGTHIQLTVSGGPQPRVIPDVKGMSYDDALSAITKLQLKVVRSDDYSNDVPVGQVAGTTPGPGGSIARDGTVIISVSKGPQLIAIPSLNQMTVAQATTALQQLGLGVDEVRGPPDRLVFDTDPPVGTKVQKGTQIALYTR